MQRNNTNAAALSSHWCGGCGGENFQTIFGHRVPEGPRRGGPKVANPMAKNRLKIFRLGGCRSLPKPQATETHSRAPAPPNPWATHARPTAQPIRTNPHPQPPRRPKRKARGFFQHLFLHAGFSALCNKQVQRETADPTTQENTALPNPPAAPAPPTQEPGRQSPAPAV